MVSTPPSICRSCRRPVQLHWARSDLQPSRASERSQRVRSAPSLLRSARCSLHRSYLDISLWRCVHDSPPRSDTSGERRSLHIFSFTDTQQTDRCASSLTCFLTLIMQTTPAQSFSWILMMGLLRSLQCHMQISPASAIPAHSCSDCNADAFIRAHFTRRCLKQSTSNFVHSYSFSSHLCLFVEFLNRSTC